MGALVGKTKQDGVFIYLEVSWWPTLRPYTAFLCYAPPKPREAIKREGGRGTRGIVPMHDKGIKAKVRAVYSNARTMCI